MADHVDEISQVFDRLVAASTSARAPWTEGEKAVWWVVSVRTQKDMGGVASVFTDLQLDVSGFAATLRMLDEPRLADAWATACEALTDAGFRRDGRWTGAAAPDDVMDSLDEALGEDLWSLDEKLVQLLARASR